MFVLGTAGHVDHGKSTLVEALTGMDPDRLAEEKRRGLTIDLGFAWLDPPGGQQSDPIGLIDVPGHLDFIRNMLTGVSGIDAAMLIVAADEGIMPQTVEHLAILDLLDIQECIPILTKIDAVQDPELLALVEIEFAELLEGSKFGGAPIWQVSAENGAGLQGLKAHLLSLPLERRPSTFNAPARLPIDRIFTVRGFGTVVTGTLVSGVLMESDQIELLPGRSRGRVRSLQAYHQETKQVSAGTRLAVNISGISHTGIQRGQVLTHVGELRQAISVDASFRLMPDAPKPVEHDMDVMVFHGATEVMARLRLIRDSLVLPGDEGFCQLVLTRPLVMLRDDRFILRLSSPSITLGGGQVLSAPSPRYWKRFDKSTESYFTAMSSRNLALQVRKLVEVHPFHSCSDLLKEFQKELPARVKETLNGCVEENFLLKLPVSGQDCYITAIQESNWLRLVTGELDTYHCQYPLRRGQPREDLLSRLSLQVNRQFKLALLDPQITALLELWSSKGTVEVEEGFVSLASHRVQTTGAQRKAAAILALRMAADPYSPPARTKLLEILGGDQALLEFLLESGAYVAVNKDVVFDKEALLEMQKQVVQHLVVHKRATMAEIRDLLGTSRKYVQALLEYMDSVLLTRREGEARLLTGTAKKSCQNDL